MRRLIWLALLVCLGIGALFTRAILTIRNEEWSYARLTSSNMANTLEWGLTWSINAYDRSLQRITSEVSKPEVWTLPPQVRSRLIFEDALRTAGFDDVLVLDKHGTVLMDSGSLQPRLNEMAERDYFQALSTQKHEGLFIGHPILSKLSGQYSLPFARAYRDAHGAFAGVVVGAVRISYLNSLFSQLNLGSESGVTLFSRDGIIISRFPYGDADVGKSIAGSANLQRFLTDVRGSFVGKAVMDGRERLYSFRPVGDYPLILNVGLTTEGILASWYHSAWRLGSFAVLLMLASLGLSMMFVRELARRQKMSAQLREAEHDVRTILNSMPSMMSYWDCGLHNRFSNDAYIEGFGMAPAQLRNLHMSELLGPELFAKDLPYLQRALQGTPQLFERTITDHAGRSRHTMISFLPDVEDNKVQGIFVQITDISDRKRMEDELFEEKERVRLTLQAIGDAVVCIDAHGLVTYLNPVAERLTGWQAFDAAGHPSEQVVRLLNPELGIPIERPALTLQKNGRPAPQTARGVLVHGKSGQRYEVEEIRSAITDRHGNVTGSVAVLRDVTEAAAMAKRMAYLAHYDPLTDLPNRVLLHDRVQLAISQARRDHSCLAVIYLDLDGFKAVNDTLGHEMGDMLLVQFAQRMKAAVRASDTVSRQGGDEFVVLLPRLDGLERACLVARKILAACDEPFVLQGHTVRVGLSGGLAMYPDHGDSFDVLSRNADSAMYAAKRSGRMQLMLYRGHGKTPVPLPVIDIPHENSQADTLSKHAPI